MHHKMIKKKICYVKMRRRQEFYGKKLAEGKNHERECAAGQSF